MDCRCPREAVLAKDAFERLAGMFMLGRREGVAGEDVAADVVDDGKRIAVAVGYRGRTRPCSRPSSSHSAPWVRHESAEGEVDVGYGGGEAR